MPAVNPSPSSPDTLAPAMAAPVTHYENFPVASLLCPPGLRQPVAAIYAFARTADDIADEGEATAGERLSDLAAYRAELRAAAAGQAPGARWAGVFGPLQVALQSHRLPTALLKDLLDAFAQDVAILHFDVFIQKSFNFLLDNIPGQPVGGQRTR